MYSNSMDSQMTENTDKARAEQQQQAPTIVVAATLLLCFFLLPSSIVGDTSDNINDGVSRPCGLAVTETTHLFSSSTSHPTISFLFESCLSPSHFALLNRRQ
ncbi:hypothetical protein PIB30_058864 [Stylosanthes scabra]|uniref:Uncharacterized protein n=1 Tax=Stylosanthes scabra TaxID=79078 RepID=A0ABU6SK25_9FABA|nr:hypothetical protein [Stylosanthes scabra]